MKRSLGKGVDSLFPVKKKKDSSSSEKEAVFSIEIEKIRPNPYQPRKEFDQKALEALAESIKEYGVLQPLLVSRIQGGNGSVEYELIAGERRFLAAKMAGLSQVPVIIREPSDQQKLEISLIENVQRLDLNPIEKALSFKRLQEEFNLTQQEIAAICGKSREAIANTLRLLELPKEIQQALEEGKITEGHARAILALKDNDKRNKLFQKIIKDGLSVREAEAFVKKLDIWQPLKKDEHSFAELKNWEERLKKALKVNNLKIKLEAGKPKVILAFKTKKEMESFVKRLS